MKALFSPHLLIALLATTLAACQDRKENSDIPVAETPLESAPAPKELPTDEELRRIVAFPETLEKAEDPEVVFHDADGSFTRKGLLISPGIIKEFLHPSVVELDLFRLGNNRNDENFTVKKFSDGHTWAIRSEGDYDGAPPVFRYHHVGRTTRGVHVLRLEELSLDEPRIACRLILLRVEKSVRPTFQEVSKELSRRDADQATVILRLVGAINLGDRDRRDAVVEDDKIILRDPLVKANKVMVNIPDSI